MATSSPKHYTYNDGIVYKSKLIDSATTTTTSDPNRCSGARAISVFLTAVGSTTDRSGTVSVEVSPDGTNFYSYNMLIDNTTNSNSQELTRISSKLRDSDGTDILFFTPETLGGFSHFKTKVTVADGSNPSGNFSVTSLVHY